MLLSAKCNGKGHKCHIGTPYCGKRFWTHQIPTSCLPTLLIFIHIEHICTFFVVFFSATIDGRNLIYGHKLHIGTKYHIPVINSCLEKCDEKCAYTKVCFKMCIKINKIGKQVVGIWWVQKRLEAFLDPSDFYFLFADLVDFYTHWTYMHIFRHIFLSNYWWQEYDIWSQASYRYPILWEAVLDPSDSYFLFADFVEACDQISYSCHQ
jgi:hypothetical protein